jgi:hypothetical protein
MDQSQEEAKSLLVNLRQHHVVQVHNPLSDDFTWQVARSVVQYDQRYEDQTISALNMRNTSHPTMQHVTQKITIPAGSTMKLPGDVAQVVAKHLVDEIMNREGHKQTIGDPHLRKEVEERILLNINDLRSKISTQSIADQLDQQIRDLNQEETVAEEATTNEQAFPGIEASGEVADGNTGAANRTRPSASRK